MKEYIGHETSTDTYGVYGQELDEDAWAAAQILDQFPIIVKSTAEKCGKKCGNKNEKPL